MNNEQRGYFRYLANVQEFQAERTRAQIVVWAFLALAAYEQATGQNYWLSIALALLMFVADWLRERPQEPNR